MGQDSSSKLPKGPTSKSLPPAKNLRIHKRPVNRGRVLNRGGEPVSSKQAIIYIATKSPFMGIVNKVRHALHHSPSSRPTNGLPLAARMAALNSPESTDRQDQEVLLRGTGRAMAKALHIAAWFSKQNGYVVSVRTMSLEAVDDVVVDTDGAEEEGGFVAEEETRTRMMNCLEVGISPR